MFWQLVSAGLRVSLSTAAYPLEYEAPQMAHAAYVEGNKAVAEE